METKNCHNCQNCLLSLSLVLACSRYRSSSWPGQKSFTKIADSWNQPPNHVDTWFPIGLALPEPAVELAVVPCTSCNTRGRCRTLSWITKKETLQETEKCSRICFAMEGKGFVIQQFFHGKAPNHYFCLFPHQYTLLSQQNEKVFKIIQRQEQIFYEKLLARVIQICLTVIKF